MMQGFNHVTDALAQAYEAVPSAVDFLRSVLADTDAETADRVEAARVLLDFAMKPLPGV